jgi:hypothetical protein
LYPAFETAHVRFHLQDATGKVQIDLQQAELDLSETFGTQTGKHARKTRTVDTSLAGWSGPSDRELLDYLSQANARIRATSSAPLPDSWAQKVKQGVATQITMESSHFAYKDASVSTLAGSLPPGFEEKRLRFTEKCLLPDRDYNIVGTCVENPDSADKADRKLIARGQKKDTFLISCKTESKLLRRAQWRSFACLGGGVLMLLAGLYMVAGLLFDF